MAGGGEAVWPAATAANVEFTAQRRPSEDLCHPWPGIVWRVHVIARIDANRLRHIVNTLHQPRSTDRASMGRVELVLGRREPTLSDQPVPVHSRLPRHDTIVYRNRTTRVVERRSKE